MKLIRVLVFVLISISTLAANADENEGKVRVLRKTQTVDFEGDNIDGTARKPDGSYLVQKRGVDFVPLYKVRERFDESIKASIDYLE